ncbi:hypothetical protein EMCRGX_G031218 [Ephydatia muelleri]|eukprot:Em0018g774a
MATLLALQVSLAALLSIVVLAGAQPEQVHLSYGYDPSQMTVVWSTPNNSSTTVLYGLTPYNLDSSDTGVCWEFTEDNPDGLHYVHMVVLQDLIPGTEYWYVVQSNSYTSELFHFRTMRQGQIWSLSFIVYGDMGRTGGEPSLPALIQEVASGGYDAILHVGDFAYDLDSDGGVNGDGFMNRIQQLAAYVPYMTCPGNHESGSNFSQYLNRFAMPYDSSPHWYSWNIGNVHFISYSTEVYFNGWGVEEQYTWLEQDLKDANTPENRAARPWIIAYGHRPMYCSNLDKDDCNAPQPTVRAGLEHLFFTYGVDIILEAHQHSYERLWPVYNATVTALNYNNPKAPVHLISGTVGCNEALGECFDPMLGPKGPWSAYRSWSPFRHGYGRLHVVNDTHIYWEQVIASDLNVVDDMWLVQYSHGPFHVETV